LNRTREVVKKAVVFTNWKMNKRLEEAREFIQKLVNLYGTRDDIVIIMCIPYPYIGFVSSLCRNTCVSIGSENMFHEEWGEFTGEVSAPMLVSVGCSYALLGHSERRKFFHESDEHVGRKMCAAVRNGLIPIVCIGETIEERDAGKTLKILDRQIRVCLSDISPTHSCYIAYEPRWAIGTGITPADDEISEAHLFIREKIVEYYGEDVNRHIGVLYGGSVTPENSYRIYSLRGVDGVGFGRCSLDFDCFTKGIEESIRAFIQSNKSIEDCL
jgi:triosephosphate isomerase